jgi:hypothetical protein
MNALRTVLTVIARSGMRVVLSGLMPVLRAGVVSGRVVRRIGGVRLASSRVGISPGISPGIRLLRMTRMVVAVVVGGLGTVVVVGLVVRVAVSAVAAMSRRSVRTTCCCR